MAETRVHTPPGDSPGGAPHPPAHQAQHRLAGNRFLIRLGASMHLLEAAELALSAAGLTWWVLTHIAGMGPGLAIVPAALACVVTARAAHQLRVRAWAESAPEESVEADDTVEPEDRRS